jgi:hypothetical protein
LDLGAGGKQKEKEMNDGMKDEGGMVKGSGQSAVGSGQSAEEAREAVAALRRLAEKARERHGLAGVPLYVRLDLRMGLQGGAPVWLARWLCGCDIVREGSLDECLRVLAGKAGAEFMRGEARRHREQADEWDRRADEAAARARLAREGGGDDE